jgi:DNA-binding winged helix-turn-helix (wHTH) protein
MAVGFYGNLRFGPFELSNRERVLRRDGVVLPLGGRAFDILIHPAECPGELIAKQELLDRVWSVDQVATKCGSTVWPLERLIE